MGFLCKLGCFLVPGDAPDPIMEDSMSVEIRGQLMPHQRGELARFTHSLALRFSPDAKQLAIWGRAFDSCFVMIYEAVMDENALVPASHGASTPRVVFRHKRGELVLSTVSDVVFEDDGLAVVYEDGTRQQFAT